MTAVLVICIVVAVTALALGHARADTLAALAQGREHIPLAAVGATAQRAGSPLRSRAGIDPPFLMIAMP